MPSEWGGGGGALHELHGSYASFAEFQPELPALLLQGTLGTITGEHSRRRRCRCRGPIDQGHDFLACEIGKPHPKNRKNGVEQIGPWPQDLIGGGLNLSLRSHRQRQQADQRIDPRLLAELIQAQPVCTGQE